MSRGAGNYRRFTAAEKATMNELRRAGQSNAEIAAAIGDKPRRVADWFKLSKDALPEMPRPRTKARLMAGR